MKITNLDRRTFFLKMFKNLSKTENFDDLITLCLKELNIDMNYKNRIISLILPNGISSLMLEVNKIINDKINDEKKPRNFKKFKINEKIKYFVMRRLFIIDSLCENKKKIFLLMIKPFYLKLINKILFNAADEIWFLSGDKSTDMNYYSKRFILMKVYAATFSFFVFDDSKNLYRTKIFLENQINLVLKFGKIKKKFSELFIR